MQFSRLFSNISSFLFKLNAPWRWFLILVESQMELEEIACHGIKKKIGDEEETKQTWVSEWVWCVPERNPSLCKQDGAWPVQSPLILDLVTSAYQQPGSH